MIRVLQKKSDVQVALRELEQQRLPQHVTPQKNWDHLLIKDLLADRDRSIRIVDLGSGDGYTLEFLHRLGFRNLGGVDLIVPWKRRLKRLLRFRSGGFVATDLIRCGDICDTKLRSGSVDVITCVSVIEHGVPATSFLRECARLLRPTGLLVVTTDYWDDVEMRGGKDEMLFSVEWTIQNRDRVNEFLARARDAGLGLLEESDIPATDERTVSFGGYEYTFLALVLRKHPAGSEATTRRVT